MVVYQLLQVGSFVYKHFLISAAIAEALDENLSPAEKRSMEAERRAAWRKARLKSLENVSCLILTNTFAKSTRLVDDYKCNIPLRKFQNIMNHISGCHTSSDGDTKNV